MNKQLKGKQYYIDRYDQITIGQCKNIKKFNNEYRSSEEITGSRSNHGVSVHTIGE